nr:hypothetical protein [Tanacetum cinerariifolium]
HLGKFDAKGNEGYFIRYSMSSKAFRVFNKRTKKVEENLHVDSLENKLIDKGVGPNWLFDIDTLTNSMNYVPVVVAGTSSTNFSGTKDAASQDVKKDVSYLRYIALPNWFHEAHLESFTNNAQDACNADASESSGNSNPTATSKNPPADQMETLTVESVIPTIQNVWILVDCPERVRPIGTKWVLKNKKDERRIVIRNKARLVAQRHTQEEGIDYDEVFVPVARIEAIRLFLAYASSIGFTVHQMDVKSAFLYDTVYHNAQRRFPACSSKKDGIFLSQDKYVGDILKKFRYSDVRSANTPMDKENPKGKDEIGKDVKLRLYRSMIGSLMYLTASRPDNMFVICAYARHQVTPKEFHLHTVKRMFRYLKVARIEAIKLFLAYASFMGFIVYQMDVKSAFLYGTIDEEVYVMQPPGFQDPEFPDKVYKVEKAMYGLHQAPKAWYGTLSKEFEALMHDKFQMSVMGELTFFLGLQVLQKKDGIFLSQDKYVGDILKKFGYSDVRSANTPMDKENPWGKDKPGHPKLGLWYPKESPFDMVAYSDSDYGSATQDRKSTTEGYQFLGRRFISWQCKKQTIVATSTTKAEYVAAASGCGQALWIQNQMLDYGKNLKLNDEEGISTLPDAELFENFALMRYNILPNQNFTFQKGQFSHQWKFLIHTIMQCLSLKSTGFNEYSSNIATAVDEGSRTPTEPHHTPSPEAQQSPHHDLSSSLHPTKTTKTIPIETPTEIPILRQYSRRATRIAQSKALPTAGDEPTSLLRDDKLMDLCTRLQRQQTEMATKITAQDSEISSLKDRIKLLEDKDKGTAELSGDDAPIKGRSLKTGEEAGVERSTKRGSNNTEEMVNILTSMDAANILTSGVADVSVPHAAEVSIVGVPIGSGLVPTVSAIFTTASVVTPYSRRPREILAKDKEEELQMLIDVLDRNNEVIAKHLQEYKQSAAEMTIGEKFDLINELVKYQDHHAKILKYQAQQSKPLSKKEQREFYMSILRSHSGWKTKHFKGMTLEEIREKFIPVWKKIEDFVPMASKEEGEKVKRKRLKLEHGSAKKMKTSEDVSKEDLKEMMQLVPVEEVYVEALQVKHPIIDWEIHTKGKKDY